MSRWLRWILPAAVLAVALTVFVATTAVAAPKAGGKKFTIALSNSFIGNKWRIEMENDFKSACASAPYKTKVTCSVYNSGNDVSKQTQQISNLISQRVDAILVDAASGTGLNGIIGQACARGILIVAYDNLVTAPCAIKINGSQYSYGVQNAQYIVAHLPGKKGNVIMVTGVAGTSSELGTTLVTFDRDLGKLLSDKTAPYAAYRVHATAATARRIESVLQIPASGTTVAELSLGSLTAYSSISPIAKDGTSIIVDRPLEDLSAHKLVAIVDWVGKTGPTCDVVEVTAHAFVDWEVAPGTPTRVSRLTFAGKVATLFNAGTNPITVYVLDRRVVARHYVLPDAQPSGPAQLRLYPPPASVPERITVGIGGDGGVDWEVYACAKSADQETTGDDAPSGLVVDLTGGAPTALSLQAPASGNLLRVHHGKTTASVLGSGDATQVGQRLATPNAPIAYDLDDSGNPVPSMLLRVAGVRWDEVPSLYGEGGAEVFATRLGPDGSETVEFGDGVQGARLPTGRGNVAASYRVGGGIAGEVASGAIDTLLGSVRGVKKVRGAGPTEGGADQDQESSLRRLVPTRARAFGRAVSAEDLVDLSLGYPGVTHAATRNGDGPPGCACGGGGLHLAFIRSGTSGPRPPLAAEIDSLAGYLDARRDATVPLCVCAGIVTRPQLTAALAVDPRRDPATVAVAVATALADPDGNLGPDQRLLGQPLDRSDIFAVIHGVTGVVGVASLDLPGASDELGRLAALDYELLAPSTDPVVTGAPA